MIHINAAKNVLARGKRGVGGPLHYSWATETYSLELEGNQRYAVVFALSPGALSSLDPIPGVRKSPPWHACASAELAPAWHFSASPNSWCLLWAKACPQWVWQLFTGGHLESCVILESPSALACTTGLQPDKSFCHCAVLAVSLNAAAPALSCWPPLAEWGVAYAVTPAALSLHDVTHMLPSVSLRFSTTHGCVCSMGLSCPWSVFPKCAEWVFRSPRKILYMSWSISYQMPCKTDSFHQCENSLQWIAKKKRSVNTDCRVFILYKSFCIGFNIICKSICLSAWMTH